jgi:hypothetical protein
LLDLVECHLDGVVPDGAEVLEQGVVLRHRRSRVGPSGRLAEPVLAEFDVINGWAGCGLVEFVSPSPYGPVGGDPPGEGVVIDAVWSLAAFGDEVAGGSVAALQRGELPVELVEGCGVGIEHGAVGGSTPPPGRVGGRRTSPT